MNPNVIYIYGKFFLKKQKNATKRLHSHIQQSKKGVGLHKKVKIREIFMFCNLKPWKSWQVVVCSFIWMSINSNQESIW